MTNHPLPQLEGEKKDDFVEFWNLIEQYTLDVPRKPVNKMLRTLLEQARQEGRDEAVSLIEKKIDGVLDIFGQEAGDFIENTLNEARNPKQ